VGHESDYCRSSMIFCNFQTIDGAGKGNAGAFFVDALFLLQSLGSALFGFLGPLHVNFIRTLGRLDQKNNLVLVYLDETAARCISAYGPAGSMTLTCPTVIDERNGA